MSPSAKSDRRTSLAQWANLVVPGGGVILLGGVVSGLALGIAFAIGANVALAGALLFPDDFRLLWRNLTIVLAALIYVAAQAVFLRFAADDARRRGLELRRTVLRQVAQALDRGEPEQARAELAALLDRAESDLSIAFRAAQVLTACGDAAADEAWRRVARLDRHGVYRRELARRAAKARGPSV